ncbi:hypothetical protein [Caudoviricetes sp.]|nr:hypothetical protein [Caudoviricetes sp.]
MLKINDKVRLELITEWQIGEFLVIGVAENVGTSYYILSSTAAENADDWNNVLLIVRDSDMVALDIDCGCREKCAIL